MNKETVQYPIGLIVQTKQLKLEYGKLILWCLVMKKAMGETILKQQENTESLYKTHHWHYLVLYIIAL